MGNKKKKVKKKNEIKRLFDLEVDEVSLVDKPAIGETFNVIKSVKGKKGSSSMGKKIKKDKVSKFKAMTNWATTFKLKGKKKKASKKKGVNHSNENCLFCKMTAKEESETMGLGLLCSVCFDCALERDEKGVFDDCIDGKFDMEKYKEAHPDDPIFKTEEETTDDDEDGEESEENLDKNDNSDDEEDSDDEEEESEEEESDDEEEDDDDEDGEDTEKSEDQKTITDLGKRITKLEKSFKDVSKTLDRSLGLHEQSANAYDELSTLTLSALDGFMFLVGNEVEEDDEAQKEEGSLTGLMGEIMGNMKKVKEMRSKAGAKVSASRMRVLREIAEKLTQLIDSVSGQSEKKGESKKALDETVATLKSEVSDLKGTLEESEADKESLNKRLDDLENEAEGSNGIDDDEESETTTKTTSKGSSIFSNIVDIDNIQKTTKFRR